MLLFAYGTLLDPDVRGIVLGRPSPEGEARPALLAGHRRVVVAGEVYPAVLPAPDHAVEGALIALGSARERDRVQFFEGTGLILVEHTVRCLRDGLVRALVCTATGTVHHGMEAWHLEEWRRLHKPTYLDATRRYMAAFGRADVADALAGWAKDGGGRGDGGT